MINKVQEFIESKKKILIDFNSIIATVIELIRFMKLYIMNCHLKKNT